jgi:hypothetical protein
MEFVEIFPSVTRYSDARRRVSHVAQAMPYSTAGSDGRAFLTTAATRVNSLQQKRDAYSQTGERENPG